MENLKLTVVHNSLTPKIYTAIRKTANFMEYKSKDIKYALEHDLFDVVIYHNNLPIGIGRIIGDGRISFIIKDVVVIPEYQHRKIGNIIMSNLLGYIESNAANGAYIGLMSTKNKEHFYEQFGFIRRPNELYGSGMVMFYEKKKNIRTR